MLNAKDNFRFSELRIEDRDLAATVGDVVRKALTTRDCSILNCINPHSFVTAQKDQRFQEALAQSDWLIPDGIGVVLADKVFGNTIKRRLTGPDFFMSAMEKLNAHGGRVVFFGSSDEVLDIIDARVKKVFPSIELVGLISPPFVAELTREQNANFVARINKLNPDFLWVGMTAPKQEKWILENRRILKVGVAAGVGAVFDFFSGKIPRAPKFFQHLGLEWLYRFYSDPLRLARRTVISAPRLWGLFFGSD